MGVAAAAARQSVASSKRTRAPGGHGVCRYDSRTLPPEGRRAHAPSSCTTPSHLPLTQPVCPRSSDRLLEPKSVARPNPSVCRRGQKTLSQVREAKSAAALPTTLTLLAAGPLRRLSSKTHQMKKAFPLSIMFKIRNEAFLSLCPRTVEPLSPAFSTCVSDHLPTGDCL